MIDDEILQLALRARLLTLSVCTTGDQTLAASATGGISGQSAFTRSAGSFLTDGLAPGMEVTAAGFATSANNGVATILHCTATVCTVSKTLTADTADASRSLAVGLPSRRLWENVDVPSDLVGHPYVEEQFAPGPVSQVTLAPFGELEVEPQYIINLYVSARIGILADARYMTALQRLFAPRVAIALSSGDYLRVRSDTGPYKSQRRRVDGGWSVTTLAIPLRLRTANSV